MRLLKLKYKLRWLIKTIHVIRNNIKVRNCHHEFSEPITIYSDSDTGLRVRDRYCKKCGIPKHEYTYDKEIF